MANVFISHSSKDKVIATRLAEDLRRLGHTPWLDSWEIRIGDCVVTKVEHGVTTADVVLLLLSVHAVQSPWVEREWKAKYWQEIEANAVRILPALIETCDIPTLLKTKRYADLRGEHYPTGLVEITQALPLGPILPSANAGSPSMIPAPDARVTTLLTKLHSGATLSRCMAEALELAASRGDDALRIFCQEELKGYGESDSIPTYRCVQTYASGTAELNLGYWGFSGSAQEALAHAARDKEHFTTLKFAIGQSLSALENQAAEGSPSKLTAWTVPLGHINSKAKSPDATVRCYAPGDAIPNLLDRIKTELVSRLVALLPAAKP